MVTNDQEPLIFQNVMLNASNADMSLQHVFLEGCVAVIGEAGHLFFSFINLSSNPQCVREGTHLGTVVLIELVYRAIPQKLLDFADTKFETGDAQSAKFFIEFTML